MKLVTVWILALAATAAPACSSSKSGSPQAGVGGRRGGTGGGKLQYPVDVVKLESRQMQYSVNAPGTIDAFQQVQITARVSGAVDKVNFVEGQQVKEGDVLASIESDRYAIAVAQARASLAKAEAEQKSAQAALDRRLAAQKESPGLVPGEEIEQKQTAVDTAKADVLAAQQALQVAQLNLRDSQVRAPAAGIVQTRTVQLGQYLQPGAVLATIQQRDPMLVRFQVSEKDAPRLKPDMPLQFQLEGVSSRTFTATIKLVAGSADPTTRMVPVTAQVDETAHQYYLRPGTFAQVTIPIGTARPGIVVPSLAVKPSEKGNIVYVVDDKSIAHERVVEEGMHTPDGGVELKQGVSSGETLVVRGIDPLSDGAPVKVNSTMTIEQALQGSGTGTGSGSEGSAK